MSMTMQKGWFVAILATTLVVGVFIGVVVYGSFVSQPLKRQIMKERREAEQRMKKERGLRDEMERRMREIEQRTMREREAVLEPKGSGREAVLLRPRSAGDGVPDRLGAEGSLREAVLERGVSDADGPDLNGSSQEGDPSKEIIFDRR